MSDTPNTEVQELTDGATNGAIAPLAATPNAVAEPLDNTLYYHVSQLPLAEPITGEEVMEIIQGGKNVKVLVAGFKGKTGETGAMGAQGVAGTDGKNGLSAFAVAQANGFVGTEQEWLATLKGDKGIDGVNGVDGLDGEQGIQGEEGVAGKSAYELAVAAGFEGDRAAWLASLHGKDGIDGEVGATGKSAYEVAVEAGFEGDEAAWLQSLKGKDGADGADGAKGEEGLSAYEVAVKNGFEGDEPTWLASLKGADGSDGVDGAAGKSAQEVLQEGFPEEDLSTPELLAAFLTGPRGPQGMRGADGPEGPAGKDGAAAAVGDSAYEAAVKNGFEGDEAAWLKSLEGKDAYEVSVDAGFEGTREEWLESLGGIKGDTGAAGEAGKDGADGVNGKSALEQLQEQYPEAGIDTVEHMAEFLKGNDGAAGVAGNDGVDGKSAYELAKEGGATGTEAEWIASLTGKNGEDGADGKSAFELAKAGGFNGTEQEWLISLIGATGAEGKSAFELATEGGFEGTQEEWIASLKGKSAFELAKIAGFEGDEAAWLASLKGDKGEAGTNGTNGTDGKDGADGKSAYQVAVDGGFEGTEAQWTASLKGDKGDVGKGVKIAGSYENIGDLPDPIDAEEAGQMFFVGSHLYAPIGGEWIDIGDLRGLEGLGLNIRGTLLTTDELPIENNRKGDAFIISSNKTMMVFDSEKWSEVGQVGPKGESAYDLAVANGFIGNYQEWALTQVGPQGVAGERGEKGEKGEPANAILTKGRVANVEALPVDAEPSDAYFVNRNLYVYDGEAWVDCGELYAKSSYDIAVDRGFPGTEDEWLDTLVGPTGAEGPQGLKGDKGDVPPGLRMRGTVDSSDLLPEVAELSDAFNIGDHTWVFGEEGWFNAGVWRGPQGLQGIQGLKGETGPTGKGLVVVGQVANMSELPVSTEPNPIALGTAYANSTNRDVYIFGKQGWFNAGQLQGPIGPVGPRGATGQQGWTGSVGARGPMGYQGQTGQRGPQGVQGVAGKDGPVGKQLIIAGRKTNQSQLPGSATIGTAYIIYNPDLTQDRVWIYGEAGWFDSGILQGPKGDTGATGITGQVGPVGPQGKALNLKGKVATVGALPGDAAEGDSWQVTGDNDNVYLKGTSSWTNIGPLRGPQGVQGIQGIQGVQGVAGIQGRGLNVKGGLPSTNHLPPSNNTIGDAYIVADHCWIWGSSGWFDGGLVAGVDAYDVYVRSLPVGENAMSEAAWIASLKGDTGAAGKDGASGASIFLKGRVNVIADLPVSAAAGDAYAIGRDIYVRMGDGTWENFGEIVGPEGAQGPEGPAGPTGKQGIAGSRGAKGDTGRSLILGDHDPQAADGVIGDTFVNTATQGVWLKSTALLWTFQGYFGGGNVYKPEDTTKTYVWKNGWVEFNRYDLASITVTGVCDTAASNVFVLDNTANTAKTISFANLPAGRVATFVVIINGKAGNMTWPAGVIWNNATAPELGATVTSVVFLYDGTRLIGSVGATA